MTIVAAAPPISKFDAVALRAEFPILDRTSRGQRLVYLDSAATSQKPQVVIDVLRRWYEHDNANIHRGVYQLSESATLAWAAARAEAARFIGASSADEIVFVRGTTEALNLVAQSFLRPILAADGWVLVTALEHHANIVPWQLIGARTIPVPISDAGELDLDAAARLLAQNPSLLAVTHVSNAIGTINPVAELVRLAHAHGVPVVIDGAQAAPHIPIDVQQLDCDFYCFSGHKVFGPTGIGILWAKAGHLDAMPPYQGGGDMIDSVTFERTTYAGAPRRFEAGTPHIAGGVGLDAALKWFAGCDRSTVALHERTLARRASEGLAEIPGLRLWGHAADKAPVVTFTLDGAHPHDIASLLDGDGICVRAGHHCTQPLHRRLGLAATVRASFGPYNTDADVDALMTSVRRAAGILR